MTVKKTILINEKHAKWLDEKALNISKFIRKKIDEEMIKDAKKGTKTY